MTANRIKIYIFLLLMVGLVAVPATAQTPGDTVDVVPAYQPPAKIKLDPVKLPPIKEKVLENGLKVIVVEHHELPIVSLRLVCKAGSQYDPPGKAGVTNFMTGLLKKGTESRSATDIADKIDYIGGKLGAGSGWSATYVTCTVLTKHLETGLDLMQDIALHPAFSDDEIERLRQQTLSSIKNSKDQPASLASEAFNAWLYGNHPYAFPTEGTEETVTGITRDDILEQYHRIFIPNNAVLFIVGDIKPKQAFKIAEKAFGDWNQGEIPQVEFPEVKNPEGYRIRLINKPDATQARIRIGHLGIARENEDYFPIVVMNYVLGGGGFSSRLMKVVRSEKGLTYGIRSTFNARLQPGPFTISTFTKNETTLEAIEETIAQLKKYQEEGPTDKELEEAKSYLTGSYPLNFETPGNIAGQLQAIEIYNLGSDYIEKYRSRVNAVTKEEVRKAARKYLHPDDLLIVVVSNADEVKEDLEKLAPVEVREIK
jgi:zinc protease